MRAFRLTADNALLFFEVCEALHADTEPERVAILEAMVELGKVEQVTDTPKTKEDYIKHLAKHFNVLSVTPSKQDASPKDN